MKRLRIIAAFMAVFLLSGCINITVPQSSPKYIGNHGITVHEKIKDSVVSIGNSNRMYGTGYFIEGNYIVTCNHVIDKLDTIFLQLRTDYRTDKIHELEIVGYNTVLDIAVLKFKKPITDLNIKPFKFRSSPVKIGQDVYLYGHPMNHMYNFSKGIITKFLNNFRVRSETHIEYTGIFTDAVMGPGSSGGVMVDNNGDIVGMTAASYLNNGFPFGFNVAIHVREVSKTTKYLIKHYEISRPSELEIKKDAKLDLELKILEEHKKLEEAETN